MAPTTSPNPTIIPKIVDISIAGTWKSKECATSGRRRTGGRKAAERGNYAAPEPAGARICVAVHARPPDGKPLSEGMQETGDAPVGAPPSEKDFDDSSEN